MTRPWPLICSACSRLAAPPPQGGRWWRPSISATSSWASRRRQALSPLASWPATAATGKSGGRGQVAPVRWEQAEAAAAVAVNGQGALHGLRDAALLAVASDALLRVSEAAALDVADIQKEPDGSGTVLIRSGKTDQEGKGRTLYLGHLTMTRIRDWLDKAGISEGALFRRVYKGGKVGGRISTRSLRTIIQARARAAGVAGRVSGHSLRVGSAQSLAYAGATVVDMQEAGRWRSPDQPGLYSRRQLAGRGAVARFRYGRQ